MWMKFTYIMPINVKATTAITMLAFCFFCQYRPLDDNNTELEYNAQQSDIIVFDHGLHYGTGQYKDMIERTRTMLPALDGGNNVKLVAWRETSSQHFNTSHGEYAATPGLVEQGCVPIRHAPDTFRSDNMIKAAKLVNWTVQWANDPAFSTTLPPRPSLAKGGVGELVIIPFRNFTHDLYYAHGGECTHYCSSPHLWLPI
jgi:hypothetical protein